MFFNGSRSHKYEYDFYALIQVVYVQVLLISNRYSEVCYPREKLSLVATVLKSFPVLKMMYFQEIYGF